MIEIRPIDPRNDQVRALIEEHDELLLSQYPQESNHLDSAEELAQPHVRFVGAYEDDNLLGCGAVKVVGDEYGEIKRVYVTPGARGRGIARLVMNDLEDFLVRSRIPLARLETGIHQHEALGLYKGRGYVEVGPFGSYGPDPVSIFMEKRVVDGESR